MIFIGALRTMLFGGSADPTQEAIEALWEFVSFVEKEYNIIVESEIDEKHGFEELFKELEEKL